MNKDTVTIAKGQGVIQNMEDAAKRSIEQTKKDFKKDNPKSGMKPPKYIENVVKKRDGSSEGDKTTTKITKGLGYVKDFEAWIKSKEIQTKKEN